MNKYTIAGLLAEQYDEGYSAVQTAEKILALLESVAAERESHEVRDLRWKLKHANKERGRMSQRIFELKGEVALVREVNRQLQANVFGMAESGGSFIDSLPPGAVTIVHMNGNDQDEWWPTEYDDVKPSENGHKEETKEESKV
ncbi:hypothetical protein SEA_KEELAN_23 [Gordonia phage Keelan]|nr:hypothetical protein SEA_KEELAN_23 [Gordonia phage Keelan]